MKMSTFSGDQIAQVNNPDPFAVPAWRSPVYHTPVWVIALIQAWRLLYGLIRFACRHPLLDLAAFLIGGSWWLLGWPGPLALAAVLIIALASWCRVWPRSFTRFVVRRVLGKWRRWHYQRHWAAVMTIGRLAPVYQARVLLPVLGRVSSTPFTDRVQVGIVSGQAAADFANRAENLAR